MSEIKLFSLHKVSNTKFPEWARPVSPLEMTLLKKRVGNCPPLPPSPPTEGKAVLSKRY